MNLWVLWCGKHFSTLIKDFIRHVLGSFASHDPGKERVAHSADLIEDILMKEDMKEMWLEF